MARHRQPGRPTELLAVPFATADEVNAAIDAAAPFRQADAGGRGCAYSAAMIREPQAYRRCPQRRAGPRSCRCRAIFSVAWKWSNTPVPSAPTNGQFAENVSRLWTPTPCASLAYAGFTPFNFPAMIPLWMLPMAIACGNTALKPSSKTHCRPCCWWSWRWAVPAGVLNVVHGWRTWWMRCALTKISGGVLRWFDVNPALISMTGRQAANASNR